MSTTNRLTEAVESAKERRRNRTLYEKAKRISLDRYLPTQAVDLAENTYEEVTGDAFRDHEVKVAEIYGWKTGEKLECLLVHEDGVRQFVGEDDTATDAGRFSFVLDPNEGDPPVRTVAEAMDLLRPSEVDEAAITTDAEPGRQGEWWIIPTDERPAGSEFKPGVGSRPYGGSPLENHVPREYGLGVSDAEFMRRFEEFIGSPIPSLETPHDVFEWGWKQQQFQDDDLIGVPDHVPTMRDLRSLAEGVFVKGTLRHRENDHYLTKIGDVWHLAATHEVEVYTPQTPPEDGTLVYEENDDGWMEGTRVRTRTTYGVD